MMNNKYFLSFISLIILFMSCGEDIIYEESKDVSSIYVENITGNTIPVHTGETFQITMKVLPPEAEIKGEMKYRYSSENEQVFTVTPGGLIQGVMPGEAVLYVESTNMPNLKAAVMVSVTDRTYLVTEIKIDERLKNFFMAVGEELDVDQFVQILPENATDPGYILESNNPEVLSVTPPSGIKALALGEAELTVKATDGSGVKSTCKITVKEPLYTSFERADWTVIPSHALPDDAAIKNAPQSLIDGDKSTCLSMVKPGKNYGGIAVQADEEVHFVIDMKKNLSFNYFKISHRTTNVFPVLRIWEVSLYGSSDGKTFVPIREKISIKYEGVNEDNVRLIDKVEYRYVKVQYTDWNRQTGSTIQIAEFELGTFSFE